MGVGLYSVHVAYAVVTPTDIYNGSVTVVPGLTPASAGSGAPARFQLHYPQPSQIALGKGVDAGEPSIGANWKTGKSMYISYLTTFRVSFDDTCPANALSSTWEDKSAPNNADSLDPILFTDHGYNTAAPTDGRTFVSELTGQDSLTAFTDDDGDSWTPSPGRRNPFRRGPPDYRRRAISFTSDGRRLSGCRLLLFAGCRAGFLRAQ
jgi:hypothetical protein